MEEVGRIVPRALKNHVRRDSAPLLAVLVGLWPRVAGRAIAEQARPVGLSAGTLVLTASSPCWAVQLQALSGEICAAVNRALGQALVKGLRVRHARRPAAEGGEPLSGRGADLLNASPAAPPWSGIRVAADTGPFAALDPQTREVLSQSFAKYFARETRGIN